MLVMNIKVRYFASIREALGAGEEAELPDGSTAAALRAWLIRRSPEHAAALSPGAALRCQPDVERRIRRAFRWRGSGLLPTGHRRLNRRWRRRAATGGNTRRRLPVVAPNRLRPMPQFRHAFAAREHSDCRL